MEAMAELPLADVAAELKKHPSSLKRAITKLPRPGERLRGVRKSTAGYRLAPPAVEALRLVQDLEKAGHSFESMRARHLPPDLFEPASEDMIDDVMPAAAAPVPESNDARAASEPRATDAPSPLDVAELAQVLGERMGAAVAAQVIAVIKDQNEQAEKYARASHLIGKLEAEITHLRSERERLLAAAAASDPRALLERDVAVAERDAAIAQREAALDRVKADESARIRMRAEIERLTAEKRESDARAEAERRAREEEGSRAAAELTRLDEERRRETAARERAEREAAELRDGTKASETPWWRKLFG